MRVRTRDNQQLHVRVLGQGQPVLMLHGLGMKSAHWLPFVWPHRKHFRFYLPDFRGAGRSAAVSFNQEDVFQNHMEDVEDIVAALGLKDFLLAGYSLGATTALHWQNVGGFRNVRAYLHIDQSPCVRNHEGWPYGLFGPQQEWVFAQMTRLLPILENAPSDTLAGLPAESRQQLLGVLGDIFSRMLGKHFIKSLFSLGVRLPWVVAPLLPMSRVADLRAYLISYTRLGRDYLPGLTGCNTPVTVLIGARSPLYAEAGQRSVAEVVKQGRVVVLEKSGHVPLIDQPFVFARELKRFLHQSR